MLKDKVDNLMDILGEKYADVEGAFVIRNNLELTKYIKTPDLWGKKQVNNFKAYKNVLKDLSQKHLKELNDVTEKIALLNYKLLYPKSVQITKKEIIAVDVPKSVQRKITQMQNNNAVQVLYLANVAFKQHKQNVNNVNVVLNNDGSSGRDMFNLPKTQKIYQAIRKQMEIGIDKGLMVQYKDGKRFSWKAYMEMNARTTMQHEIGEQQIIAGTKVGQVFYICDSFADCAEDHSEFQGKIYYNASVPLTKEIKEFINKRKILSMQQVREKEPFLTTRPNCRHNFHAIPLNEVMHNSPNQILNDYGLAKGKYKKSNYEKMQKQRYMERTIRKYKMRKDNGDLLFEETGDEKFKPTGKENLLIRKWQKRLNTLVKNNDDLLKRDYDRENIRVITSDLGARYYSNKEK